MVLMVGLDAVPYTAGWHSLVPFISSQTLCVHTGPQFHFSALNASVGLFGIGFELLILRLSMPYVPITDWTIANAWFWLPLLTVILSSMVFAGGGDGGPELY